MDKLICIVTGATSGIGMATARAMAAEGYKLIITGRRADRLKEFADELRQQTEVLELSFDVRNYEECRNAIENLANEWKKVSILINNAGLAAGLAPIDTGSLADWEQMIDTNVKGLLYMTKLVVPLMKEVGYGHIVNIGSIAGKMVYPNGNVYCASKHAVDTLTQAMRIDLLPYDIKVSQVAPGMADTEFSLVRFKGDKERADNVYKGFTPLYANDIADAIRWIVTRPKHVCINDMLIMPAAQATATIIKRTE